MVILAEQLRKAGQYDESIVLLREAVARRSHALGPDHVQTAHAESDLARSFLMENRHEEAVRLKRHAVEVFSRSYGPNSRWVLTDSSALAGCLYHLRHYQEVEDMLKGLLPRLERVMGAKNEWAIWSSSYLALAESSLHKFGPAIELQRRVVDMSEAKRGHDDKRTQRVRFQLAAFLHWAGQDAEARFLALAVLHTKQRLGAEDEVTENARKLIAAIEDASQG